LMWFHLHSRRHRPLELKIAKTLISKLYSSLLIIVSNF
jgi:hypothetical protein